MANDILIKVHDVFPKYYPPTKIIRWRWYCKKCQRGGFTCSINWNYVVGLALSHARRYHED